MRAPSGLVDELEQVVAGPEREHGVQRGDVWRLPVEKLKKSL
jgi:hypothetical protein